MFPIYDMANKLHFLTDVRINVESKDIQIKIANLSNFKIDMNMIHTESANKNKKVP